jgi:tRNA G10  N-methylase Trm11
MRSVFLKLRANIELDGDISIAEREIIFFCNEYFAVQQSDLDNVRKYIGLSDRNFLSNTRKNGIIGFVGFIDEETINNIIIKSSFIQEIWTEKLLNEEIQETGMPFCELTKDNFYCIVPLFPMGEFLTYYKKNEVQQSDVELFAKHLSNKKQDFEIEKIIFKSSTSTPHTHGLHKYKAKFFPRLIRTFLVTESENKNDVLVLDPFVGSGTTLVESAFLGYKSIGVDIDKLSCLISDSKVKLLKTSPLSIQKETEAYRHKNEHLLHNYKFPSWISKKFDRWGTTDERNIYEQEISSLTKGLENLNGEKKLFQTAISDAVSRKFNIRMMGTGVGRFALEIQKSSLDKIVNDNIKFLTKASSVVNTLKSAYNIDLDLPKVVNGNATSLKFEDNSVDIILTSPPYLPASSGREDYLIGKSISITALNLMSEEEIKQAEEGSIGSMKNQTMFIENGLPDKVYELYAFLKNDPLRNIKAEPTYTYYKDIKKSLEESFRVLKTHGKAIYVIGKESVFYTFKTREILFKAECDKIFGEIAKEVGFKIKEVVDIELNKKNKNARPRALDKYYESVFILEKS